MFADEARFGRMNRPRPCWAPNGMRPQVASQLVREYVYLYGAVSQHPRRVILLFVDGRRHHRDELEVPANIMLHLLPPYSPQLNP
jgi:transposase